MVNAPLSLTAAPEGILPVLKAETASPEKTMRWLYGWEFSYLAKRICDEEHPEGMSWVDVVNRFRAGVTVQVRCETHIPNRPRGRGPAPSTAEHRVLFHPDGSITMLDHPELTKPRGGHSSHVDLDTEMFMHSLGAGSSTCLRLLLWMLSEQRNPSAAVRIETSLAPDHNGWINTTPGRSIRSLYAAVAWAQHPAPWPASAWDRFLKAGTTPRVLAYWVEHGWTVQTAIPFLNRKAAFKVAEAWRQARDVSARSARYAGLGNVPADDIPWQEVGFTRDQADKWRKYNEHGRPKVTPAEAWEWQQRGVMPRMVSDFQDLPRTDEEAQKKGIRAPRYRVIDPTFDQAVEWAKAGIPSDLVLAWYRYHGDNIAEAQEWCRAAPVRNYPAILAWNDAHPEAPLTREEVTRLQRLGVPYGDLMGRLSAAGLTNTDILRPLDMLPTGRRWLGIEARRVLAEAIDANRSQIPDEPQVDENGKEIERHKTAWDHLGDVLDKAREGGSWEPLVWRLRSQFQVSPLWGPYVDWLVTHPTPPAYPQR